MELEITAMTFGPYGVGRVDGRAVMVPNAAPGDRLEVAIAARRRDYDMAEIREVIAPGPARRITPCPYLPRCGGCDWQQIDYRSQVRIKSELIAAELSRVLRIQIDPDRLVEPASAEFGYRSRIRLKSGPGGALGYRELASSKLVAIECCAVAEEELRIPFELARMLGRNLDEVEIVRSGDREVVAGYLKRAADRLEIESARRAIESDPAIAGIVLRAGDRRDLIGDVEIELEVEDGLTIRADGDLFSQVNRAQNRKLVAAAIGYAAPLEGAAVLDLFCGAGNLSLPAARRGAKVTGVDADRFATAAAGRNAARLGFDDARFVAMKAEEITDFLRRARYKSEVVILDPPRTGASLLMEPIAKLAPKRIIYISCDVTTLARDLALLERNGYRTEGVHGFDFFPNTHHVEIVAHAVLT